MTVGAEVAEVDYYETMHLVVSEMLKGATPSEIAKRLKMKPRDVQGYISSWSDLASNNIHIQQRAKEAVTGADQHFSMIIDELWKLVTQADTAGNLNVKQGALKSISDVESKRINILQAAGLLDNQELADQVLDTQAKHRQIIDLLKEVASNCPTCRKKIQQGLQDITNEASGIVVEADVVA